MVAAPVLCAGLSLCRFMLGNAGLGAESRVISHMAMLVRFSFGSSRMCEAEEWCPLGTTLGHMSSYTKNASWPLGDCKGLAETGKLCKGPDGKYLGVHEPYGLSLTTQFCCCSVKAGTDST